MPSNERIQDDARFKEDYRPWLQKLESNPDDARTYFEIGSRAIQLGDRKLAVEAFAQVTLLAPHVEAGFFNLGNALFSMGEYESSIQAYRTANLLEPSFGALNNIGNALAASSQYLQAIDSYQEALTLPHLPRQERVLVLGNIGKAHSQLGSWQSARTRFQEAFQLDPRNPNVLKNHLRSCLWFEDFEEAISVIQAADPSIRKDFEFHWISAQLYQQMRRYGVAMLSLIKALELHPEDPRVFAQVAEVNFLRGRRTEALFCYERARDVVSSSKAMQSQWLHFLLHRPEVPREVYCDEVVRWANRLPAQVAHGVHEKQDTKPQSIQSISDSTQTKDRLRIGFVCHDAHPLAPLDRIRLLESSLDSERFAITCFSDHVLCSQETNNRSQTSDAHLETQWICTAQKDPAAFAKLVVEASIDVLIDTIGHGNHQRLDVFGFRPAKLQIAWTQSGETTGANDIDFLFSDRVICPASFESLCSEKVYRFPSSVICWDSALAGSSRSLSPTAIHSWCQLGVSCSPEKISEELIQVWATILSKVPDSRLRFIDRAFQDDSVQNDFRDYFQTRGVDAGRLFFSHESEETTDFEALHGIDVLLDPFPVNDTPYACRALCMGIPVICLLADRMAGRTVASMLSELGRTDWIAHSLEEYIAVAVQLASDVCRVREMQDEIRRQMVSSSICNSREFARQFSNAITELYRFKFT